MERSQPKLRRRETLTVTLRFPVRVTTVTRTRRGDLVLDVRRATVELGVAVDLVRADLAFQPDAKQADLPVVLIDFRRQLPQVRILHICMVREAIQPGSADLEDCSL